MIKVCNKCNIEKDLENFNFKKDSRSGKLYRRNICISCETDIQRIYDSRRKLKKNEYYLNNKTKINKIQKQYNSKNRNKILEYSKQYYLLNREKLLNKNKFYRSTSEGNLRHRLSEQKRRILIKQSSDNTITVESVKLKFKEQDNKCYICNVPISFEIRESYDLEHKIPLSRNGKHTISNIALSCPSCNNKKYMKTYKEILGDYHE